MAGIVGELLQAAPGLKILVTSRERLNLQEETLYRVGGLKVPGTASYDAYDDLIRAGGMAEAKKQGTVRMEGKTYIVKDGDVCHFLFNV